MILDRLLITKATQYSQRRNFTPIRKEVFWYEHQDIAPPVPGPSDLTWREPTVPVRDS